MPICSVGANKRQPWDRTKTLSVCPKRLVRAQEFDSIIWREKLGTNTIRYQVCSSKVDMLCLWVSLSVCVRQTLSVFVFLYLCVCPIEWEGIEPFACVGPFDDQSFCEPANLVTRRHHLSVQLDDKEQHGCSLTCENSSSWLFFVFCICLLHLLR